MLSITDQTATHALISVIVPAYNVEKYLARCLDSILSQTYTNLEVILIDDGSTDSTGKICDDYARKDERVRVIHQTNQGQAVGRNAGISIAKGEWIQFVDSDDWIEPDTLETCYDLALKHNAEIVCFQYVYEYDSSDYVGRKTNHGDNRYYADRIMSGEEAFSVVMQPGYLDVYAWNKLTKKSLYDGIKYPCSKTGEDVSTTYKIVIKAGTVVYTAKNFYHYFQQKLSVTHKYNPGNLQIKLQAMREYIQMAEDRKLNENYSCMINIMSGVWFWKVADASSMIKHGKYDREYIADVRKEIRPYVILKSQLSPVRKIQILLFKFSFRLYAKMYMKHKRK